MIIALIMKLGAHHQQCPAERGVTQEPVLLVRYGKGLLQQSWPWLLMSKPNRSSSSLNLSEPLEECIRLVSVATGAETSILCSRNSPVHLLFCFRSVQGDLSWRSIFLLSRESYSLSLFIVFPSLCQLQILPLLYRIAHDSSVCWKDNKKKKNSAIQLEIQN